MEPVLLEIAVNFAEHHADNPRSAQYHLSALDKEVRFSAILPMR